jgi:SAM-dependent methyltransferase
MDVEEIVSQVLEEQMNSPVDLLGMGHKERERNYLTYLQSSYVRTVGDINAVVPKAAKILEIGSYLGVVSVSLKKCGYDVSAMDIPEYQQSSSLRNLYASNGIPFAGINLRKNSLPYAANSFDAVVICEVLEHLNFNPLPILKEINRILKKGGYIYTGMPNQASLENRRKLLKGVSVHNPIEDFLNQLDRDHNMIVGLHWREYTMAETVELLEKMGFTIIQKYYFKKKRTSSNPVNSVIKSLLFKLFPELLPYQVVIGKKVTEPDYDFWITEANA